MAATPIHLDGAHIHEALAGRVHLNFAFHRFRPFSDACPPLFFVFFLTRYRSGFFPHLEDAKMIRTSHDNIEECSASNGTRTWNLAV